MMINRIRDAIDAKPFRAFTLCLTDGQRIAVTHPHNVLIPNPRTRDFVVSTPDGLFRFVDALLVSTLGHGRGETGNGPNGRKRKPSS
jgi:hypothetical protein